MYTPATLRFLLLTLILGCQLYTKVNAGEAPNVVFVFADQWRAQAMGYAGDPNVKTPNLDRFAAEGINLTGMISNQPVCTVARATLLTGQRPLTHGLFINDLPLNPAAVSLGKVFKAGGYDTGYIGKWHVDGHGRSAWIPQERRQGFDYWKALECTHAYNQSPYYNGDDQKIKMWEGYDAYAQTQDLCAWLKTRKGQTGAKPFFFVLSWGPPHNPYETAPAKYKDMYEPAKVVLPPNVPDQFADAARKDLAGYYAHCSALDDCFGQIVEALEASGLRDNTLLVFTSDHGDMLYSHGMQRKQRPYDESIRVPMLVQWPKGLPVTGVKKDALISYEDLMPTLLGLAGLPIPQQVEGLDYSDYLKGGDNPGDGVALVSCPSPFGEYRRDRGGREFRGLRTERYTYVCDLNGPWLLFDNEKDPFQMDNLVGKTEVAGLQAQLDAQLKEKLKSQGDEFLPGPEYIKKWKYVVDESGTVRYKR